MKWMAEQGASVVGCDLSELAAEEFFSENNIPYKKCMCVCVLCINNTLYIYPLMLPFLLTLPFVITYYYIITLFSVCLDSIDNFTVFESTSNAHQIKLLAGSIFNCTKENTGGPFDIIWDCNALVAINPEDREKYIDTHNSLLKPSGRILLSTYEYSEAFRAQATARPPHTIPPDVVKTMYERLKFRVNLVESIDYSERFQIRFNIPQTVRHLFYISK